MCFSFRSSCGQRGVLRKSIRETGRRRSEGTGTRHRRGVSQIRGGHEGTECTHEDPGTCKTLQAEFVSTYADHGIFRAFIPDDFMHGIFHLLSLLTMFLTWQQINSVGVIN